MPKHLPWPFGGKHLPADPQAHKLGKKWAREREGKPKDDPRPAPKHKKG